MTDAGQMRTKVIGDNATMSSLGRAFGPALQLMASLAKGESSVWKKEELHSLICFGFALVPPYMCCLCALPKGITAEDACNVEEGNSSSEPASLTPAAATAWPTRKWICAFLLEIGSLMIAVGSGMTFKFWPLFFKGDYGFSVTGVCCITLSFWVAIAGASQLSPKLAKCIGRKRSIVLTHYVGTGLLFIVSCGGPAIVIVPLVVLRNAVMNANTPITQSLVMDLVPGKHRGKWSGIASLRRLTWSGSAFVGGWLSDSHDYRYAFFITACFHSVSGLFLILAGLINTTSE
eukprot:TRINITY_DN5344_c0_g1_i1.p1 TRINITY_DN5344_c0_g1~~TRINITY_DN5344_c0_g1_i1.p1  ORF type:complete len:290 (-),score=33.23 TRINITY_DN5344_c0_g1_i1:456-1325(-)